MALATNDDLMLLALVALLLDALIGSHRLLGRVPGPDSLIRIALGSVISRLDRWKVGAVAAALLGALLLALAILLAAGLGHLVDQLDTDRHDVQGAQILLLTLMLGQRGVVDTARLLADRLDRAEGMEAEGRFAAARWTVERLTNRFADGLVGNLFWFVVAGFAGLLAYRALSIFAALGSGDGVKIPRQPLFLVAGLLYWILGAIPGLIASVILVLAGLIGAPGRVVDGMRFMGGDHLAALPLRSWPLRAMAGLLGVSIKAAPDDPSNREWIGKEDARARVTPADVRRAMLIIVIAWLTVLLILGTLLLMAVGLVGQGLEPAVLNQ